MIAIDVKEYSMKNILLLFLSQLFFLCISACICSAEEVTLTADSLSYDPTTRSITAIKDVHFKHLDGELFGDKGTGYTDGRDFEMRGNVKGIFKKESLNINCYHLKLQTDTINKKKRRVTASGGVKLTQNKDNLAADTVTWLIESDNYKASGNVIANFTSHFIDSDEAGRDGEKFWAKGIRKYEDHSRRFSMSADRASGLISKADVVELTAVGDLVLRMTDEKGKVTRVTGDKGVFSRSRGTVVISGNATAYQEGRTLIAESVIYRLDDKRIEALGRPKMILDKLD